MELVIGQHFAGLRAIALNEGRIAVLRIHDVQTSVTAGLHADPDAQMVLPWGSQNMSTICFKDRVPSPMAMENAIMVAEDALMAVRNLAVEQLPLHANDDHLQHIAQLSGLAAASNFILTLEDVERAFNLLADHAEGRRATHTKLLQDPLFSAYLLILRECMHHLRFASIHVHP